MEHHEVERDAEEILFRMARRYQRCNSYRDTGVVTIRLISKDGEDVEKRPFTTAFVRPDQFRFEFSARFGGDSKFRRCIIWKTGEEVLSWWDLLGHVEAAQSLGLALASATGLSGGAAHRVPALLLPEDVPGFHLTSLKDPERQEDADFEGTPCYRVRGTARDGHPFRLWINRSNFTLLRIDERFTHNDFEARQRTTYTPEFDTDIAEEALTFLPEGTQQE